MRRLEPQLIKQEGETLGLCWQHPMLLIPLQEHIILVLNTVNCKLVKSHSDWPPSACPVTGTHISKFLHIGRLLSSSVSPVLQP